MATTKLILGWTFQNGHQGSNTLHYTTAATPSSSDLVAMANAVGTAFANSDYREFLTAAISLREVSAQVGTTAANPNYPASGQPFIWSPTTDALLWTSEPLPGTNVDDGLQVPPQVASVVSIRTGVAGRRRRGRVYLPGPAAGHVNSVGVFGLDFVTAAGALLTDIDAQLDFVLPGSLAVVSMQDGVVTPATTWVANSRTETQRRRTNPA